LKRIEKEDVQKIIELYNKYKGEVSVEITPPLEEQIYEALCQEHVWVLFGPSEESFLILYQYNDVLSMNPWFFNGVPFGAFNEEVFDSLCKEAREFFEESSIRRLELIGDINHLKDVSSFDIPLPYVHSYTDMALNLTEIQTVDLLDDEISFRPIRDMTIDELKACYHDAFSHGDAKFYFVQSDLEKVRFWDYLNYPEAKSDSGSLAMFKNDVFIGFSFDLQYGTYNKHVSCMCIATDYQGKGYGKYLLQAVINDAIKHNNHTLSLGTETTMKAFKLYHNYGFKVLKEKAYYILIK